MFQAKKVEWDLSPLAKGDNDSEFEKRRQLTNAQVKAFVGKWRSRDDFLTNPDILKQALDEFEQLLATNGPGTNEHHYFSLRNLIDQANPKLKAKLNNIDELERNWANDLQFFSIRIARIPKEKQSEFLNHLALQKYHHFLERSFDAAKFLLSEEEEKIMMLKSRTSYEQWVDLTEGLLSKEVRTVLNDKGKKQELPFTAIQKLMEHPKKTVRDTAAKAFNEIIGKWNEVAENEINAILGNKKVDDTLRNSPRPDTMRHVDDDIETEVVDALLSSVSSHNDISQKFYTLKAKLLGLKKMQYHERNLGYGKLKKAYSYPDAASLVHKVFSSLDPELASIFQGFVEQGLIDVFPKKGKRGGACCISPRLNQPTYILLNHTNKLEDVLTLAHESGHGINNELMRKKQHSLYFNVPMSTAEVASTFMEDFVLQEILKTADDELRLAILVKQLNDSVSTIIRQVACYRFEQSLHNEFRKAGYLSKEDIGKIFLKHMHAYMGPTVELSPGSQNWWVYWTHIREFFYVYSYASGLLISKSMQSMIKRDPSSIAKVKEFLSSGTSDSPKNIFAKLGIDITQKSFWDQGMSEVNDLLKQTQFLAKKLRKI